MNIIKDEVMHEIGSDTFNVFFNKLNDGLAIMELVYNEDRKPIDYIYKDVNKAYELITNVEKNKILGKRYSEVYSEINHQVIERYEKVIVENKPDSFEHYSESLDKYYHVSVFPIKQLRFATILTDITEKVKSQESNENLNKILNASRLITNLILKEKDSDVLLNKACEIISSSLGSGLVWISTFNNRSNKIKQFYCSDKNTLYKLLIENQEFPCIAKIISTKKLQICDNTSELCEICLVKNLNSDQSQLIVPIGFNNLMYGVLNVSLPQKILSDSEGFLFFNDLANDLAYALFNLEIKNDLEFARKKIREYYLEIENQNNKLMKLNSELELKNDQLKKANDKALESERLKSTFLANISHEIRTPLNGILGFTQLISQPNYTDGKIEDYIDIISQSGNQLLSAINSILDISRIESKQLPVNINEVDINSLFDEVLQLYKFEIQKKDNVQINKEIENLSGGHNLLCDENKLKQILNILIHNAIKFTHKGQIDLGVKEENGQLIFFVKDTGIGIEKEKFDIIFNSFRQSDETNTRKYGGIGLGLSIAKGLVNLLNGEIWIESEIKKGSVFYFTIPYLIKNNNKVINKTMDFNKIETLNWGSKTILIVEDDVFSAEYLAEALGITKVNIVFARNGNEAVDMVKNNPEIDLVLMDIQLPDLSGDKAASEIRKFNLEIPIIAQTAHAMVNDKETYIKSGCSDYISKPISVNDLYSILCKYI